MFLEEGETAISHFRYTCISLLYHLGKLAEQDVIKKPKASLQVVNGSNWYAYVPKIGFNEAFPQLPNNCTTD
mgnify:FL=1